MWKVTKTQFILETGCPLKKQNKSWVLTSGHSLSVISRGIKMLRRFGAIVSDGKQPWTDHAGRKQILTDCERGSLIKHIMFTLITCPTRLIWILFIFKTFIRYQKAPQTHHRLTSNCQKLGFSKSVYVWRISFSPFILKCFILRQTKSLYITGKHKKQPNFTLWYIYSETWSEFKAKSYCREVHILWK